MSSQDGSDLGQNVVMCYFPSLPYYLRYQTEFIILRETHGDSSVAGESRRLIYVDLYFTSGFTYNPAVSGGMPHRPSFRMLSRNFSTRRPHSLPPMFSGFSHVTPHFDHHIPMAFEGRMMRQEQHYSLMFARVINGQLGTFMEIDDARYDFIRQCNVCGEFHRESGHSRNISSQRFPSQNPHKQPGHSRQHSSTSGITGQRYTSNGSPHASQVSSQRPPFYPPTFPNFPDVAAHFDHHLPMRFEGPQQWGEQRHSRVFQYVGNVQPRELTVNEVTLSFIAPRYNMHGEVIREPEQIYNNPSLCMTPQRPRKQIRDPSQHPSTSGTAGQRGTSRASPRTLSECVATEHKGHLQNEDTSDLTQPTEGEIMLSNSVQGIQHKNYTAASASNRPTADSITQLMNTLDVDDQNIEENVSKENKKPSEDSNVDNDN